MTSSIFAGLERRLTGTRDERFWRAAAVLLGLLAALRELDQVFRGPFRFPNDALQFTAWMARWSEPALRGPDLVLDYWQSVSPWVYALPYRAAFGLGLDPVLTTKLLPALLLVLLPLAAFRLGRRLGADPAVAFVLAVVALVIAGDPTASGTPRGFWPLLLILVVDGLVRQSLWQTALAQGLLAGSYPQAALVSAGAIGLSPLLPGGGRLIDLSRPRIVLVAACALATIAGVAPTLLAEGSFGPVATLADARAIPTFAAGGRGEVFEADGSVDLLCGERLGFFGRRCEAPTDPRLALLVAVLLTGPAVLLWRALRPGPRPGSSVIAALVLSGTAGAVLAQVLLFRLHLPNRYSDAAFLIAALATALVACEAIRARIPSGLSRSVAGRLALMLAAAGLVGGSLAAAQGVRALAREPERPGIVEAAARTPPGTRLAGFVNELDYVPVFARRGVYATREHAIAYQLGYFRELEARMQRLLRIVQTPDPAEFRQLLANLPADRLLVEEVTLASGALPPSFQGFFAPAPPPTRPTALSRLAPSCEEARIAGVVVLDVVCLSKAG
ncbi:hypothetical protein [Antarcticirhabdus aurantiaca]|uniref:Uncharacterized protein n=1 Tax=Antarcticirhabdus aurantiaca TaxID=2606717 RepID=A0ACD4NRN4_9HYPH|nr:hypothetical protein [Antarcticirhabdus aurantiaca]WAJ29372.1 hypothetical protein OXU80_03805 [Jeongeuplla avenae]